MPSYFVTGATGFIGRHLVERLLAREGDIHVLVRPGSEARVERLGGSDRIRAVTGDLGEPYLGLDEPARAALRGKVDHFFHLAAIYDMTADETQNVLLNVGGTQHAIDLANDLIEADGIPVLFTGDFNDREDAFCPIVGMTPLEAANGGSNDGTCRPPVPTRIDWIFGSSVRWLSYLADEGPNVRRTTDHPMIVAHALLEPPEGTGAAEEAEDALGRTEDAQDQ